MIFFTVASLVKAMRVLSVGLLLVIAVFVPSCLASHAKVRNERTQQVGEDPKTFVVRYKNGNQTIPVTVVLDYKKQTEYVINMNPRTPAKSVTLYDFKQRTIAYKDLTNRECFLGRLTDENLNEETEALNRIQSPVDHMPKVLSLDPHRSSLTPTEIRNIAGQKTAVFCRKMNTWLVAPQDSHSIRKRAVDDTEEHTYHRHGFQTVQYSHYGRETRRRFRNTGRNGSRPSLYENKNTSRSTYPRPGISETGISLEDNVLPQQSSFHGQQHLHEKEESPLPSPDFLIPESIPGVYDRSNRSLPILSNRVNEHELPSHFGSELEYATGGHKNNGRNYDSSGNIPNTGNKLIRTEHSDPLQETSEKLATSDNAGSLESKVYPQTSDSSFQNPEINEFNIYPTERNSYDHRFVGNQNHLPENSKYPHIETEWPSGEDSQKPIPERTFPKVEESHEIPDVSTNVLEIPKIGKKFENLDHSLHSGGLVPQTNEDVHDIFEGFYNLKENYPLTNPNYFHNSQFIPLETDQDSDLVHSESYPIKKFPTLSHSKISNLTNDNEDWKENEFANTIADVIDSTDSPVSTTLIYNEARHEAPPNHFTDSTVITSKKHDAHDYGESISYPAHIVSSYERTQNNVAPLEPISVLRHQLGNSLNTIPSTHFTTDSVLNSQIIYSPTNQRSDIPSETDHIGNDEFEINVDEDAQGKKNQSRPFLIPTEVVREGVSPQQVRFQNALRNYKPDEIVIDVERIPTERPPESTSGFQDRTFFEKPKRKPTSTLTVTTDKRNEQVYGGTWRSTYSPIVRNPSRKNNNPRQYISPEIFPSRQYSVSQHHRLDGTNEFPYHPVNNMHRRGHVRKHNIPNQPHYSRTFDPPHYPLESLPPGVSIHPRHPQAPYADMFLSNMPPSLHRESSFRTMKPHRQRHHRKKNKSTNSCCRASGKANSNLSSCCRNGGGSCCSGHRGRTIPSSSSCCSSTKNNAGQIPPPRRNHIVLANEAPRQPIRTFDDTRVEHTYQSHESGTNKALTQQVRRIFVGNQDEQKFSSQQNRILVPNDAPQQQQRRPFEDNRDRCLKERMCRTVYESTQKVIVCRNANIDGCSL